MASFETLYIFQNYISIAERMPVDFISINGLVQFYVNDSNFTFIVETLSKRYRQIININLNEEKLKY